MSRSVHATRKQLRETQLRFYRDEKLKAAELAELEQELTRKCLIKDTISARRRDQHFAIGDGPAVPLSIRVADQGPHILHPASPEDLEGIRHRLPPGVLDGLSEIVLSLGDHVQQEGEQVDIWDPDPITNRIGLEVLPGLYQGYIWGTYDPTASRITLHCFVCDPAVRSLMPTTAYLKLQILSTFVHEAAHHFDDTQRVGRGRWLADETEKVEDFARNRQYEWTRDCVIPYMEEAYPQAVADLLDWLAVHGGVRFKLGELISDPRRGHSSTIETAIEELSKDVQKGTDRVERLFNFAVNLKIADRYERAQEVIDRILAVEPSNDEAIGLRASIWIWQECYEEALELALAILAASPRNWDARATLIRAYEGLQQWTDVIERATESLTLVEDRIDRTHALRCRCMAYWMIGKRDESDEDLRMLRDSPTGSLWIAPILRRRAAAEARSLDKTELL